jgi:hypothetical protein
VYPNIEERIIALYGEVLQRQPNATELINATRDIQSSTITWEGLRQRLMDAEEYDRIVKLQSNALTPELDKVLADSRIMREIVAIYRQVKNADIPQHMILPLRDIYTSINYNPFTLAAILQDQKYTTFEADIKRMSNADKSAMLQVYAQTFDQTKLAEKSEEIARSPDAASIIAVTLTNNNPQVAAATATATANDGGAATSSSAASAVAAAAAAGASNVSTLSQQEQDALREVLQVLGASPDGKLACSVDQEDSCMTPMAKCIQANAKKIFDIHGAARRIELPHKGQMVLRPEFAWSVPQQRSPVCTSVGQRPMTQPMMDNSKLLLGTPLDEASDDTQVGSIMPKFEYKEYVDVPLNKAI